VEKTAEVGVINNAYNPLYRQTQGDFIARPHRPKENLKKADNTLKIIKKQIFLDIFPNKQYTGFSSGR
jgi:hypothetical protein